MNRLLKSIAGLLVLANIGILSAGADEIPLPDDYMQLEWIRSTPGGQQYINTEYVAKVSDVVTCVVDVENVQASSSTWATIFGAKLDNADNCYAFFSHMGDASNNKPSYHRNSADAGGTAGMFSCGRKTKIVCDATKAQWWPVDEPETVKTLALAATVDCVSEMYIFTENIHETTGQMRTLATSTWNTMKLYSFTIETANGLKIRDYVPCRAPGGKVGLWDKVTGEFFGNANLSGTEDFHGSDEVDVFVSYIQSSRGGQQYLNTKYIAKANDVVTCVVNVENEQASSSTFAAIFGSKVDNGSYSYAFFTHDGSKKGYTYKINYPHYERGMSNVVYEGGARGFTCGQRTTLICDSHTARWWADGSTVTNKTADVTTTLADCQNNMYVFTENIGPANGSKLAGSTWNTMKLYSFKIESNGTTVRHLLPYRTAAGKFGAYDIADHSGEDGYIPLYLNAGTGADFSWGGVAYTREDGGATIAVREGTLSDFDIEGYSLVKKSAFTPVNATAVTNYPALTLTLGKFSLQNGLAAAYAVSGTFTLTGGAQLAIDLTETDNDRLTAGAVNLSGASAENPVVIEIAASGLATLATDANRPFIIGAGLTAEDAAKFTVKGFAAEVAFADGVLVLRGLELPDAVWTGADSASSVWSSAANWADETVPPSGAATVFNLAAGGTSTFDLAGHAVKGVKFGAEAGAFSFIGPERLSILSYVTNLSTSAQTFTLPLTLGVAGQPFDIFNVGPLSITGDVTPAGSSMRKDGTGTLTISDTVIARVGFVELAAGVTRINYTGRQTTAGTAGELRIGPGAQLDLNLFQADTLATGEAVHCKTLVLAGDGPDHEGALVNYGAGDSNKNVHMISHLVLAGDAAIGSVTTPGARIDVRRLDGSACNEIVVEGPYTLTANPGNILAFTDTRFALDRVIDKGHFVLAAGISGVITNGIHVKNGAILNCGGVTVPAEIPVIYDEGRANFRCHLPSTIRAPLTVESGVTVDFSNDVHTVEWTGSVTNNGTIVRGSVSGVVTFSGALRGSGRIEGALIKMGATGCWYLAHDDTGWTEKMDVASAGDFLPSVRKMEVTVADSTVPAQPLVICPSGSLTAAQVAQNIALTVRDGAGAIIPNCWLDVVDENLVLRVADSRVVRTAVWTGASTDPNNLADPANWACTNDVGLVVDGGLPMTATTVVIPGAGCTFNCPADAALTCRNAEFTYPVTLAADCDWRGLDVAITNTVDLCGHKLYVSDLKGTGAITDSTACYQPVEYIQSTGTQFINTKYCHRPDDRIVCTAEIATSGHGNYGILFGAIRENKTDYNDAYAVFVADGNANTATLKYTRSNYRKDVFTNGDKTRGKKITIDCQGYRATWTDGSTSGTATVPEGAYLGETAKIPLVIFNFNKAASGDVAVTGDSTKCAAKLYSFQIFNKEGALQRDFVPMKKLPEGVGVLYDRVTGEYYENAGTGMFGVGAATDSVQAGELHFDVPAGKSATHSAVALVGAVRLVKDGAGTLTLSMQNQAYGGGTDVSEGTIALGASGEKRTYGAAGTRVWVRKGATFDVKNYHYHSDYTFVLDGGTITGIAALNNGQGWFRHVVLTDDSQMTGQNIGFVGLGWSESLLEMNDHKLTIEVTKGGQEFYMGNITVTGGGRIVGNNGGWLVLGGDGVSSGKFVHAETTTLEVPNIGTKCRSTDIRFAGYVASYLGGNTDTNTGYITVTERFTPSADTATWYDTLLTSGVTMDLSHLTQTFNTTCSYYKSGGSRTVSFDEGAVIYVDFRDRHVKSGTTVIAWTDATAPDSTVEFKPMPGSKYLLRRTDLGVVYDNQSTVIFLR